MTEGLLAAFLLKELPRTGWVRRGVPNPESVAAHSWGVSLLVLALLPEHLDLRRALTYAVLHDLPEALAGDWTPHEGRPREAKVEAERAAMDRLGRILPRGEVLAALWHAYEAQADEEARFVRQLDRLDMALQALRYEQATGQDLAEFLRSARTVLRDPELLALLPPADDAPSR